MAIDKRKKPIKNPANQYSHEEAFAKIDREFKRYLVETGKIPSRNHLAKVCRSGKDTVSAYLAKAKLKVDQPKSVKRKETDLSNAKKSSGKERKSPLPMVRTRDSVNIQGKLTPELRERLEHALEEEPYSGLNKRDWWHHYIKMLADATKTDYWTVRAFLRERKLVN